jgi:hypothetical protein
MRQKLREKWKCAAEYWKLHRAEQAEKLRRRHNLKNTRL